MDYIGFQDEFKKILTIHPKARRLLVPCLSRALSYKAPLPPTPVSSPSSWYSEMVRPDTAIIVSRINELFVCDTTRIMELTYRLWQLRYFILHHPLSVPLDSLTLTVRHQLLRPPEQEEIGDMSSTPSTIVAMACNQLMGVK